MALRSKSKAHPLVVPVQDMVLRISAPESRYEEVRAAGLRFWEQLDSYGVRHREFRTSDGPVEVPEDAPAMVREMADAARVAGVGPSVTVRGALTDFVGRWLGRVRSEVIVANGGDYFVRTRRRSRLAVRPGTGDAGRALAIVVDPGLGAHGISSTGGRHPAVANAQVVVVARSCTLADAAAASASAVLSEGRSVGAALHRLQGIPGVHGALVVLGDRVGVTGKLELAA